MVKDSLMEEYIYSVIKLYDIFPTLLQQNIKIKVCEVQSPFLDIGTPETLMQAEKFIKENFTNLIKPC